MHKQLRRRVTVVAATVAALVVPATSVARRTTRADLVGSMRPKIAERGIASEAELDEVDLAVRAHLSDPNPLVMQMLFVVWGRKPAA